MGLRASEWIIVGYFAYLAGTAIVVRGIDGRRRQRAIGTALAVVIAVLTVASFGTSAISLRDWMPPGALRLLASSSPVASTNQVFERRLLALDQRWLGSDVRTIGERAPRRRSSCSRFAYLFCSDGPLGFACL